MDSNDRNLGMNRAITRRNFLNGVSIALAGSALAPKEAWAMALNQGFDPESAADYYPPTRTGMRGDHPGSFEVAHKMRDDHGWDLSGSADTGEKYDLIIVGGGISGLSAAHFFLSNIPSGKVLILDNHDDFGGHAKRNEFHYNGRMMALNGGTLNIESPLRYNAPAKQILADIGIDLDHYRAENAKNRELYPSLGLRSAYFFDKETWEIGRAHV